MGADPGVTISPPLLSGFDAPNQVVLGALTLAELHKQVGETVEVSLPASPPPRCGSSERPRCPHSEGPGACIWRWVAGGPA